MKGRKMLSNSEVAVFCEQSGMILESGLSMLECFHYGRGCGAAQYRI